MEGRRSDLEQMQRVIERCIRNVLTVRPMEHLPGDYLRQVTIVARIPSGAKARGFIARFDVRAEARTLHLKPVPFT